MKFELPQGRIHYFDAVRGLAFLVIVIFHAAGLYVPGSGAPHDIIGSFIFFFTDIFVMATFFLIAGYFGALVYEKRGAIEFIKDRTLRILGPLLLFVPITYAAFLYITSLSDMNIYRESGLTFLLPADSLSIQSLPLFHLWFLYLLVWYYIITLVIILMYKHSKFIQKIYTVVTQHILNKIAGMFALLGLVIVTTAALLGSIPDWYAWYGVPNQTIGLIILPSVFFTFLICFLVGWLLFTNNKLLQHANSMWKWILALGVGAAGCAYMLLGPDSNPIIIEEGISKSLVALLYATGLWGMTVGFIGLASRVLDKEYRWIQYITKASYWTYLIHLPISFGLHIIFAELDWNPLIAIPIMVGITMTICLVTYEYCVRNTIIGRFINGPRKK